jgi:abortive infection bacteriophage resistance protein
MFPEYLKGIKSHYNKQFIKKNIQIKRHHERNLQDKYAPCWKTFEYYTFGSIVKIYENIKNDELKKTIALRYNVKKSDKFLNVMNTLVFVRNSSAHSGVVYDLHIDEGISELNGVTFNNSYSHNMDAAIRILLYLTHQISIERNTELDYSIDSLTIQQ